MKTMTIFVVMNEELGRLIQLEGVISSARLMYYYPERVNKDWHEEITISDEQYEEYESQQVFLLSFTFLFLHLFAEKSCKLLQEKRVYDVSTIINH